MSTTRHITEPTVAPPIPQTINVTITEEDRQNADHFCRSGTCILSTALKRMGFRDVMECLDETFIYLDGGFAHYKHHPWVTQNAHYIGGADKPHYAPEVVGKSLVLTLAQ